MDSVFCVEPAALFVRSATLFVEPADIFLINIGTTRWLYELSSPWMRVPKSTIVDGF